MHRTDGSDNVANLFTDGNPGMGVPATVIEQHWLNDLQENVCRVIEDFGLALVKDDYNQLRTVLRTRTAKCWGKVVTDGIGGVVVTGLNVNGASIASNVITVNFLVALADVNYVVVPTQTISSATTSNVSVGAHSHATGLFKLSVFDASNARMNPAAVASEVRFVVFGNP